MSETVQGSLFGDESVLSDNKSSLAFRPTRIGQTKVNYSTPRDILTKATGFMSDYDFTLNPYSGCSFGCTYCYAAFFTNDVAKEASWGTWVTAKENATELLKKRRPGYLDGKRIYLSSVTDPYQPLEKELKLTRRLLEIMSNNHTPKLVVQTRSPTVVNDIDLYRKIEKRGGRVQVNMTITTDDESIRKAFEPYCPSNHNRLEAIKEVQAAGIDTCITMTPLLLVRDHHQFIENLMNTGVRRFIIQPFHYKRGKFVAGTRDKAFELLSNKLNCDKTEVAQEYTTLYQKFLQQLKADIFQRGLPHLGEGKDGFKPPF